MITALGLVTNNTCPSVSDYYATVACPAGSYKKSKEAATAAACTKDFGLVCEAMYMCVCRPCEVLNPVAVSVSLVTGNTSSACSKLSMCAAVLEGADMTAVLLDNWAGDARTVQGLPQIRTVTFHLVELSQVRSAAAACGLPSWFGGLRRPAAPPAAPPAV